MYQRSCRAQVKWQCSRRSSGSFAGLRVARSSPCRGGAAYGPGLRRCLARAARSGRTIGMASNEKRQTFRPADKARWEPVEGWPGTEVLPARRRRARGAHSPVSPAARHAHPRAFASGRGRAHARARGRGRDHGGPAVRRGRLLDNAARRRARPAPGCHRRRVHHDQYRRRGDGARRVALGSPAAIQASHRRLAPARSARPWEAAGRRNSLLGRGGNHEPDRLRRPNGSRSDHARPPTIGSPLGMVGRTASRTFAALCCTDGFRSRPRPGSPVSPAR